jgi:glycerol-3-phosphate responsive antiterminator
VDKEKLKNSWKEIVDIIHSVPGYEECKKAMPDLVEVEPGHMVRCCRLEQTKEFKGIIAEKTSEDTKEAEV